jgi:acylpyruvate hydrolase
VLPAASRRVDYEGELAAVIGASARRVSAAEALEYVAGYTAANDVTARDFQNVRGQHFIGKSCDSFAPMGPVLVTADEIPDPQDLELRATVSGETRQSARTKEMVFSVAALIAFASQLMTLEPGDVILTGTPSGVGAAQSPPRWLEEGDVVDVEIERIGRLRNYVRRESAEP